MKDIPNPIVAIAVAVVGLWYIGYLTLRDTVINRLPLPIYVYEWVGMFSPVLFN